MVTQPTKRQLYVQRETAGTGRVSDVLTTPSPQLPEGCVSSQAWFSYMDANIQLFKEGHVECGVISTAKSMEVIVA